MHHPHFVLSHPVSTLIRAPEILTTDGADKARISFEYPCYSYRCFPECSQPPTKLADPEQFLQEHAEVAENLARALSFSALRAPVKIELGALVATPPRWAVRGQTRAGWNS